MKKTMKTKKTLGYVPFGTGRFTPFDQVYQQAIQVEPEDIKAGKVDGLVIWGGADISPCIYGQKAAKWCGAGDEMSMRDAVEVAVVAEAIKQGVPIIGVCRGAQLVCAMAGGKLVQHVNHHSGDHLITTKDGMKLVTNSYHHQMMYPFDVKHDLIAWTTDNRATIYMGETGEMDEMNDKVEPEVVYFPEIKALGIQGHPEFLDPEDEFVMYSNQLVREYLC